jgi:flagellar hook-associated protein 1
VSDLFTSLTSASRALDAQRYGLDVAGQNIANVNTPGYARRTVDMVAVAPDSPGNAGRGVDVVSIRSLRDRLLERRLGQEVSAEQRQTALVNSLSVVESTLGTPGKSIDLSLQQFFNSFSDLSQDPTSAVARQQVVLQGANLASQFRGMAARLEDGRRNTDLDIRGAIEDVNDLTERISALNALMGSPSSQSVLHLQDEQAQLVRQLSELVDINVVTREEGGVDISIGNGRPLVVGNTPYTVIAASTAPSGYAALTVNGTTVTSEITGGRLGGLITVRDTNIPDYLDTLDALAYEVVTQVNTLQTAGFDLNGNPCGGGPPVVEKWFFEDLSSASGAAAAMVVDAAMLADASRIAAAGIAVAGDNQTARAMAALRDARVLNGNTTTFSEGWSQLVYRVGRDTKSARDEQATRAAIVGQVESLRDEVSGVSLDEEAMHLLKFQRAYEANARFFRIIDESIETLLNELAR